MLKHTKETKTEIIARCNSGETVPSVSRNTGIPKVPFMCGFQCQTLPLNYLQKKWKNASVYWKAKL